MWFVYLLYSKKIKKHYIGYTNNLRARLVNHNSGKGARFTRMAKDWKIIYYEEFDTKEEAMSYEYRVKNDKVLRKEFYKKSRSLTL